MGRTAWMMWIPPIILWLMPLPHLSPLKNFHHLVQNLMRLWPVRQALRQRSSGVLIYLKKPVQASVRSVIPWIHRAALPGLCLPILSISI